MKCSLIVITALPEAHRCNVAASRLRDTMWANPRDKRRIDEHGRAEFFPCV